MKNYNNHERVEEPLQKISITQWVEEYYNTNNADKYDEGFPAATAAFIEEIYKGHFEVVYYNPATQEIQLKRNQSTKEDEEEEKDVREMINNLCERANIKDIRKTRIVNAYMRESNNGEQPLPKTLLALAIAFAQPASNKINRTGQWICKRTVKGITEKTWDDLLKGLDPKLLSQAQAYWFIAEEMTKEEERYKTQEAFIEIAITQNESFTEEEKNKLAKLYRKLKIDLNKGDIQLTIEQLRTLMDINNNEPLESLNKNALIDLIFLGYARVRIEKQDGSSYYRVEVEIVEGEQRKRAREELKKAIEEREKNKRIINALKRGRSKSRYRYAPIITNLQGLALWYELNVINDKQWGIKNIDSKSMDTIWSVIRDTKNQLPQEFIDWLIS